MKSEYRLYDFHEGDEVYLALDETTTIRVRLLSQPSSFAGYLWDTKSVGFTNVEVIDNDGNPNAPTVGKVMPVSSDTRCAPAPATTPEPPRSNPSTEAQPVCAVCREPLSRRTNLFGESELVHARGLYETYDHEPEPIAASQLPSAPKYRCDYCHADNPTWYHWGKAVVLAGSNFGERWAACDICHVAVQRRHVMGVIRQIQRVTPNPARTERLLRELGPEGAFPVLFAYIPTVNWWAPRQDPHHPPRLTAAQLPKVRARLVKMWDSDFGARLVNAAVVSDGAPLPGIDYHNEDIFQARIPMVSREGVTQFCKRQANGINVGELYWMSAEFTELALRAGRRMTDLSLAREDLPAASGLIYFDTPLTEMSVSGGELTVHLQVLSWVLVPRGIWVTTYGLTDRIYGGDPRMVEGFGHLAPWNTGAGAPFGSHDAADAPNIAVLLAAWALMQQERFATIRVERPAPAKSGRRKPSRSQRAAADTTVQVVDIRRRERTVEEKAAASSGRKIDYQQERAGHWKMQFHGPGRALRKRIWIDPYWVGAPGAPVRYKSEKVTRLQ